MAAILTEGDGVFSVKISRRRVLNVLVQFDWTLPNARDLLAGVVDYAKTRPWRLVDLSANRPLDAVIRDVYSNVPPGLPTVSVQAGGDDADVRPDQAAIGRMAAEHFYERGFRAFAHDRNAQAGNAFDAATRACNLEKPIAIDFLNADLAAMVSALPTPVAAFVQSGGNASALLARCGETGKRVPDDVAILCSGSADEPASVLADPPLSVIDVGHRRLGRQAAARLDKLLRGRPVAGPDLVPPAGVVLRASTDTLAVADPDVRKALGFLRDSGGVAVRVTDLMRATALDRRTLERRFQKTLGRPPAEVLRRHRTARAAELLRTTDRPVGEIARACGYRLPQHLAVAFRAAYGQTPGDYRASVR